MGQGEGGTEVEGQAELWWQRQGVRVRGGQRGKGVVAEEGGQG